MEKYIDLHTHTYLSDGNLSPLELIEAAQQNNISHLAITDHNRILDNIVELQNSVSDFELISGSEISAEYFTEAGEKKEIHIVGLFLKHTKELKEFLEKNRDDGTERFAGMLVKLSECGVEIGCSSLEEFKKMYFPGRSNIGRPQLAEIIMKKGYTKTMDEAMDIYIGDYGEKRAYVPSSHKYADIKSVINIIHKASGVAILAHPFSYKLDDKEVVRLIECFAGVDRAQESAAGKGNAVGEEKERVTVDTRKSGCTADAGDGIEVYYAGYDDEKRKKLSQLAKNYLLLESCGSDYHGKRDADRLDHGFSAGILEALKQRKEMY